MTWGREWKETYVQVFTPEVFQEELFVHLVLIRKEVVKIPWDCLFGRGDTGDQRGLQIQAWDFHLIPEWNVLVAGHFPDGWSSGCPLFLILKAPELGCERGERSLSTQSLEGHPPGAGVIRTSHGSQFFQGPGH